MTDRPDNTQAFATQREDCSLRPPEPQLFGRNGVDGPETLIASDVRGAEQVIVGPSMDCDGNVQYPAVGIASVARSCGGWNALSVDRAGREKSSTKRNVAPVK